YGSTAMYDFYDEAATPAEALSIAQQMAKVFPSSTTWQRRVALQQAMAQAVALVAERRFADALDVLGRTDRPSGSHGATWALLKAGAAAGAGQVDQAYAWLSESAAAAPDPRVQSALREYGTALGKTVREVDADVWK